jgi:heme-degrading monooxygenase HmoA
MLPFIFYAVRTSRQAKNAQGNLAVSLFRDAHNTFWTRTVWTSESAVKAYMLAEPHRKVMRRLAEWCDEAAVARWEQQTSEAPDWHEAHRRLQTDGRRSKVNHPSPAHESFQIPAPNASG